MEDCVEEQLLKYAELAVQEGTKHKFNNSCFITDAVADPDSSSAIKLLIRILNSDLKIYFDIENFPFSLFFPGS